MYDLIAVICHHGTAGGKFLAYKVAVSSLH